MKRIILNLILIFTIHGIFSTVAATQYESCSLHQELEKLCNSYTYTVVRPMLDYYRQVSDDLKQSHEKDEIIRELREKLVRNEVLIPQLQSQINSQNKIITEKNEEIAKMHSLQFEKLNKLQSQTDVQKQTIDKLTASLQLYENYNKCKEELALESKKLQICEFQLNKVNSSLIEKDDFILRANRKIQQVSEYKKAVEFKLQQSQEELLNKVIDRDLCQSEVIELKKTALNIIPSICIPFGENPGIHQIKVSDLEPFDVLCDSQLAGPGWLVMQQRIGGNENFNRNWISYRKGFGSLDSDFFFGLEKIHRLTNSQRHELYIHLVDEYGKTLYARYDDFKISNEDNGYALSLGEYTGDAGDAMRDFENLKFSTFDRDNDIGTGINCARLFKSGWWFKDCSTCNLNDRYNPNIHIYMRFDSHHISLAKMLIRPKN